MIASSPSPKSGTEWSVRKRRPVRRKHIAPLSCLEGDLAIDLNVDGAFLEMAEYGPWTMVFVDRTPLVIELLDEEKALRVLDPGSWNTWTP